MNGQFPNHSACLVQSPVIASAKKHRQPPPRKWRHRMFNKIKTAAVSALIGLSAISARAGIRSGRRTGHLFPRRQPERLQGRLPASRIPWPGSLGAKLHPRSRSGQSGTHGHSPRPYRRCRPAHDHRSGPLTRRARLCDLRPRPALPDHRVRRTIGPMTISHRSGFPEMLIFGNERPKGTTPPASFLAPSRFSSVRT